MWMFVGLLSLLGLLVFLVLAVIFGVKKNGKAKKMLLCAGGAVVLFFAALSFDSDISERADSTVTKQSEQKSKNSTSDKKEQTKAEKVVKKPEIKTPQQEMIEKLSGLFDKKKAFDAGSYVKGDIPLGEYAFISFDGSGKYYGEEDLSGNIIDNENFDSFGYVYVHGAGNIQTDGVLVSYDAFKELGVSSAKEIYEMVNNLKDFKDSGWYKVGVDIQPGQYTIESMGEGYVAVLTGPVGKNEIVNNENINGRFTVNITNGQYLQVSRGTITQ
ncbi:hypothetical protein [Bacillus massilinigeriensis]|uniref:hypothetical protein n=1 Tax=Bacillus mediterraneensis TaxID=1805474 RepID=UPI0008F93AE2|nr:hypothetical protein [Bacillus mediterraneensis]